MAQAETRLRCTPENEPPIDIILDDQNNVVEARFPDEDVTVVNASLTDSDIESITIRLDITLHPGLAYLDMGVDRFDGTFYLDWYFTDENQTVIDTHSVSGKCAVFSRLF